MQSYSLLKFEEYIAYPTFDWPQQEIHLIFK